MNVVIVRANPRKNGYTQSLTDLFIEGLRQGKAQVSEIDLTTKKINQCLGCYTCWLTTPGTCVHRDDMASIMKIFTKADIAVFSTPLYIYNISGYLKVFFDRLLPYMENKHCATPSKNIRNAIRHPSVWPRKMVYILVGAFRGLHTFAGAKKTLELFGEGLNLQLCGGLIRPESYLMPFMYLKPKTIHAVKSAFTKAGVELVTEGYIKDATMQQANKPFSESIEHFIEDSNIYWEEAQTLKEKAKDLDFMSTVVVQNPKILLSEMIRHNDPKATARVKARIQFCFTDKNAHFTIIINKGTSTLEETKTEKPDLCITTRTDIWAKIFLREISAPSALIEKKLILEGDKSLFSRFDKYFPLPFD
ncbi:NAD(P)H-dependent oxidoreductase [Candidatus Omnitrophota bacterium]